MLGVEELTDYPTLQYLRRITLCKPFLNAPVYIMDRTQTNVRQTRIALTDDRH